MNLSKFEIPIEKRNKWLLYVLNILLIILAVSVWINGFSPCEKCKLRLSTMQARGLPDNYTEITCLDLFRNYSQYTIKGNEETEQLTLEDYNNLLNFTGSLPKR